MSFSIADRMMQPSRQTRAMSGSGSAQPKLGRGRADQPEALRIAEDFARDQRLFQRRDGQRR